MIRNLKFRNKAKKRIRFIVAVFSVTLLLSGCADGNRALYADVEKKEDKNKETIVISDMDSNVSDTDEEIAQPIIVEGLRAFADISNEKAVFPDVILSNSNYNSFLDYIENYEVDYEFSHLYFLEEALEKHSSIRFSSTHNSNLNSIDGDELYRIVIANNKAYLKNEDNILYEEIDKEELKSYCDLIAEVVNSYLKECPSISQERIKCILSDLKMFEKVGSMSLAYVTPENHLVISPTQITMIGLTNEESDVYCVLTHEIIHLLQKGCNCDISLNEDLVINYGMSFRYDGLKVNSLDNVWLYDAAAEKCMSNYRGIGPITYKNMIGYLESLSMVNIINDDFRVHDTEHLLFERDIEKLYDFFDVTTEEDKREILNMLYSIEVMQNLPSDFIMLYEKEYGVTADESEDSIRYNVKKSICQTFNKLFYRNLANKLVNDPIPLGDVFYLISAYETDLNNHILYHSSAQYQYNDVLMKNYVDMQSVFFELLATANNMSLQDIMDLYSDYTTKAYDSSGNVVDNFDLRWLGSEKAEYIDKRMKDINLVSVNVVTAYEYFTLNAKEIQ
ncbi:MAG: hypothetical protein IKK33_11325 [Lachnospiraceae bacterium]|nr:hypothetical protein [Lachnospiraceae bacterium]